MNVSVPPDAIAKAVKAVRGKVDTSSSKGGVPNRVERLRNRHHTIARLVASNVPRERICREMGLTWNVLDLLINQTPAFAELVAKYRDMPPLPELEGYIGIIERSMIAAELEIADRVLEEPEKMSISELHKVSRDAADRLGYSKHSVNLNINMTLAERLEGLRRRSRAPVGAGDGGGALSTEPSPRSAPPLLDLKAESGTVVPTAKLVAPPTSSPPTRPPLPNIRPANTTRRTGPPTITEPIRRRV